MNAILDQKRLLAEALLAEPAITADTVEPAWAVAFREAAATRLRAMGAPVRRDEYWKYTDPTGLTEPLTVAPASHAKPPRRGPFAEIDALTLTFVNGFYRPDLSDPLDGLDGVEVTSLATLLTSDGAVDHWAISALGALEIEGQAPVERPLAALNGALARDGALIRVTGQPSKPIHLRYEADGRGAAKLRSAVRLEPGASVSVIESGPGAQRFNTVLEVAVADDASFHHVRAQIDPAMDQVASALFAKLGNRSRFKSFTLRAAAMAAMSAHPMARNEAVIWLTGDHGSAHIAGGVLGRGEAHGDNTVFLTHDAEDCESRQVFKTVLDDKARGVFQGKILVKEGAQRTDGYQISQSILLNDGCEFDAKPELEIYADDVKCSHGSTTGAIDATAMFYLRSRGVDRATAEALLVAAFIEEAIAEIDPEAPSGAAIQDAMRAAVARWMEERAGAMAAPAA